MNKEKGNSQISSKSGHDTSSNLNPQNSKSLRDSYNTNSSQASHDRNSYPVLQNSLQASHITNSHISMLFSTNERTRILEDILDNPSAVHKVSELGRRADVSKGAVSGYIQVLVENNIVRKKGNDIILNIENPFVCSLKRMLNIAKLSLIADELKKLNPNSIGVYGAWAHGNNGKQNVINFWIRLQKHPGEIGIAGLQNSLRERFGDVNILTIDDRNLDQIKQDTDFYYTLKHSLLLCGEGLT
ncbi:MAG: hypothetical protein V1870_00660 [Candidatus Aenigmatarchaeota archaeon]